MTALALPIVLPAALVITAALLVWYVAEWITVAPLAAAAWSAPKQNRRAKAVNAPKLTLST